MLKISQIRQKLCIARYIGSAKTLSLSLPYVALLLIMLTARPLPAEVLPDNEILSALEIKQLISGKTVEMSFVTAKEKGFRYFSPVGAVTQLRNNWLESGNWKVNESNRLCFRIAEENWNCRILIKDKEGISQYIAKKDGNHLRELSYTFFYDGDQLLERAKLPSLPLEQLTRDSIIDLFADKTVESETVRKKRVSLTYYRPDGTLELVRNGRIHAGLWRVTGSGRMCLKIDDSQEKCRIIVREGSTFSKYIVKKNGQHQHSIRYRRFIPGKQL